MSNNTKLKEESTILRTAVPSTRECMQRALLWLFHTYVSLRFVPVCPCPPLPVVCPYVCCPSLACFFLLTDTPCVCFITFSFPFSLKTSSSYVLLSTLRNICIPTKGDLVRGGHCTGVLSAALISRCQWPCYGWECREEDCIEEQGLRRAGWGPKETDHLPAKPTPCSSCWKGAAEGSDSIATLKNGLLYKGETLFAQLDFHGDSRKCSLVLGRHWGSVYYSQGTF